MTEKVCWFDGHVWVKRRGFSECSACGQRDQDWIDAVEGRPNPRLVKPGRPGTRPQLRETWRREIERRKGGA